jgi:hypothetical protein
METNNKPIAYLEGQVVLQVRRGRIRTGDLARQTRTRYVDVSQHRQTDQIPRGRESWANR